MGFDSLKALTIGVGALASTLDEIAKGGLGVEDVTSLPALFSAIVNFKDVKFADVLPELKDLNDAEKAVLVDLFKKHLEIQNDNIEVVIEKGQAVLLSLVQLVLSIKDAKKPAA